MYKKIVQKYKANVYRKFSGEICLELKIKKFIRIYIKGIKFLNFF